MFLKIFFHFFGCRLPDYAITVVMDCYFLITLSVLVFGCGYYDFLNKLVYQFGRESFKAGNSLRFINKPL